MDEKVLEQLEIIPCIVDDEMAYEQLKEQLNLYAYIIENITEKEQERLNYELNLIKKWGLAKVFLFGLELFYNNGFGTTLGAEGYSYINFLLHLTPTNPLLYNLPFERFFNEKRRFLPEYCICTEKGKKGLLLKHLYKTFGKYTVVRANDNEEAYFVSNKPFDIRLIKQSVIVASVGEETYEENVSVLTSRELYQLGFYSFTIVEVEKIKYSNGEQITEKDIYKKAKELFSYKIPEILAFTDIDEIKEILKDTEYKLIYQEQLMEILNKVCGFNMVMADHLRREIAKAKKESLTEVQRILNDKYGEKGQKFFNYLYKNGRYTISKAYVIQKCLCV